MGAAEAELELAAAAGCEGAPRGKMVMPETLGQPESPSGAWAEADSRSRSRSLLTAEAYHGVGTLRGQSLVKLLSCYCYIQLAESYSSCGHSLHNLKPL